MENNILEWCKAIVVITPKRWLGLVKSVPIDLLSMRPAPREWSALECLQHTVDVEQVSFPVRLKALLAGQPFPGFNPNDRPPQEATPIALAEDFERLRQQNLILLNQLTEADLDKQALHAEYGVVSMRQFLHHWAGHDLNHLVQAERALLQPFIQGCGPWDINYVDHKINRT